MPRLALAILLAKGVPVGTAYVIVFGVNTIFFSPSMFAVLSSPLVNNKSPCRIPLIPNLGNSLKQISNLSATAPE